MMKDPQRRRRRIGGYLVLLVGTAALFWGWRLALSPHSNESLVGLESAVTPDPNISTEITPFFLDPDETDLTPVTGFAEPGFAFTDLPILSDSSLAPAPVPFTYQGQCPEHHLQRYVVARGDTPGGIAERFNVRPETLLGGNPRLSEESSLLQTDIELLILPIDGVLHDVQLGDTLERISLLYGIPTEEITAYEPNKLTFPFRLCPDSQILVPGAVREVFVWTPPTIAQVRSSFEGSGVVPIIVGTGTFVHPVNSRNFTQFYWYGHRGIDIALAAGSAVVAADTGTVTFAGWNIYGFGNLIVVNHGNGFETFYGHLSSIKVVPGQIVFQGNVIGATGDTGNSSGPHIHFEIRINANQDDPCWYLGGC